jgi:hypothetical protein
MEERAECIDGDVEHIFFSDNGVEGVIGDGRER